MSGPAAGSEGTAAGAGANAMALDAIDHVWFWVRDMDRAVAFYADALGLRMRMRHGDDWAEFEGGGARIGLHGAGDVTGGATTPHGGTVVFAVEDLDLAKAALQERGVVFEEHAGEVPGYARYASFNDPDGNSMQIIEYRSAAEERG